MAADRGRGEVPAVSASRPPDVALQISYAPPGRLTIPLLFEHPLKSDEGPGCESRRGLLSSMVDATGSFWLAWRRGASLPLTRSFPAASGRYLRGPRGGAAVAVELPVVGDQGIVTQDVRVRPGERDERFVADLA